MLVLPPLTPGPISSTLFLGAPSLGLQDPLSPWLSSSVPRLSHRLPYRGASPLQPPGWSGENRGGGLDSSHHTPDPAGSPVGSVSRRAPESDHVSLPARPERPSALSLSRILPEPRESSPSFCPHKNPFSTAARVTLRNPVRSLQTSAQNPPVMPIPLRGKADGPHIFTASHCTGCPPVPDPSVPRSPSGFPPHLLQVFAPTSPSR